MNTLTEAIELLTEAAERADVARRCTTRGGPWWDSVALRVDLATEALADQAAHALDYLPNPSDRLTAWQALAAQVQAHTQAAAAEAHALANTPLPGVAA